jgi:hypothetical protein
VALTQQHFFSEEQIQSQKGDLGTLGYFAKKENMQFTGYLIVHENCEKVNLQLPAMVKIKPLTDEQYKHISQGNLFIRKINGELISLLEAEFGIPARACDPYLLRPVKHHPSASLADSLLSPCKESIEELKRQFIKNPAIASAQKYGAQLQAESSIPVEPEHLAAEVERLGIAVRQQSANPNARIISRLNGSMPGLSDSEIAATKFLDALFALRKCIETVDGVLFESFNVDRFVVLSSDNIFAVQHYGHDSLGTILTVKVQPNQREAYLERGSLVILSPPADDPDLIPRGSAIVESYQLKSSSEWGMTLELTVRCLDEWLTPYPGMMEPPSAGG